MNLGKFKSKSGKMRPKHAFTLIELLVVVSIIALLVSILLPSLSKARRQAKAVVCSTRISQLGVFNFMYAEGNEGRIPPMFADQGSNRSWSSYMTSYITNNSALSTKDESVFWYNNGVWEQDATNSEEARQAAYDSVLCCPETIDRYKNPPVITPTYARNSTVGTNLDQCALPSSTIFFADTRMSEYDRWVSAYPWINAGLIRGDYHGNVPMTAPHVSNTLNVCWVDGHVTRENITQLPDKPGVWEFDK